MASALRYGYGTVYGDGTAQAKLHFATELVASVILRTAREQEESLSDDAMTEYIRGIFDDVTAGWRHAVNAVHVVIAGFLAPVMFHVWADFTRPAHRN